MDSAVIGFLKPFRFSWLQGFLGFHRYISGLKGEISNLKARVLELEKEVCIDHLTGLYNRKGADMSFHHLFSLLERGELESLGLLMIDLDNFKTVNDTLGHLEGDIVLRQVADIMRRCCRASDEICRLGGDEFFIVLVNETQTDILLVAEKLRDETKCLCRKYGVTVSIGSLHMTRGTIVDESFWQGVRMYGKGIFSYILDTIDKALYASKKRGKDALTVASIV